MHVLPSDIREKLDIFVAHVWTILREQKVVNELLSAIAAVPTATRIVEINAVLAGEQQHAAGANQQYSRYLLIFSAVLVGLFLYAAVHLVRSNQKLNQKTAELGESNNQLDRKVSERTKELNESVLASLNMMDDAVRERENTEQAYRQTN